MTHPFQSSDLTTNLTVKKMKQQEFNNYFTTCITEFLRNDPNRDVTTVKVDLKLCNLKPRYAKLIVILYNILKTDKGRNHLEQLVQMLKLFTHCTKNEVFYYGFLRYMWPNPQFPAVRVNTRSFSSLLNFCVKIRSAHIILVISKI